MAFASTEFGLTNESALAEWKENGLVFGGGYSTSDASFGHFSSGFLEWSGTFFMLAGGLPFAWYIRVYNTGQWQSEQVQALVGVLAPLPDLDITWIDTAPDRFPAEVPAGVTVVPAREPASLVAHAPREAEHLILTYSHALDLELCHRLLGHGFASAGLIGSATKWARFRSRLAALGHPVERIARITCPIGDPALGKHPQAIALGVAARLLRPRAAHPARKDQTA